MGAKLQNKTNDPRTKKGECYMAIIGYLIHILQLKRKLAYLCK